MLSARYRQTIPEGVFEWRILDVRSAGSLLIHKPAAHLDGRQLTEPETWQLIRKYDIDWDRN